jgi:DNA-binding transcriptional regulator LsrR (DeoR family)
VVSEESAARALRSQPMVAAAMDQWGRITRAAIAVGSWDPPASQLWDAVSPGERTRLRRRGVVAEVGGTLLAEDGSLVDSTLPARCISMSTEQLKAIPSVVMVAGGPAKKRAVRAVLRSGLASAVVTDEAAARAALEE